MKRLVRATVRISKSHYFSLYSLEFFVKWIFFAESINLICRSSDQPEDVVLEEEGSFLRLQDEGLRVCSRWVAVRLNCADNIDDDAAVDERLRVN